MKKKRLKITNHEGEKVDRQPLKTPNFLFPESRDFQQIPREIKKSLSKMKKPLSKMKKPLSKFELPLSKIGQSLSCFLRPLWPGEKQRE